MIIGIVIFILSFLIQVVAGLADKYGSLQFDFLGIPFTDFLRVGIIIPCGVAGFLVFAESLKTFCLLAGFAIAVVMIFLVGAIFE